MTTTPTPPDIPEHDEGCPHHGMDHICNGILYKFPTPPADIDLIAPVAHFFKGDPVKTKLWFETLNPMLGDVRPCDMPKEKVLKFIREQLAENTPADALPTEGERPRHKCGLNISERAPRNQALRWASKAGATSPEEAAAIKKTYDELRNPPAPVTDAQQNNPVQVAERYLASQNGDTPNNGFNSRDGGQATAAQREALNAMPKFDEHEICALRWLDRYRETIRAALSAPVAQVDVAGLEKILRGMRSRNEQGSLELTNWLADNRAHLTPKTAE